MEALENQSSEVVACIEIEYTRGSRRNVYIQMQKMNDLNSLIDDLTCAFEQFNDLIDSFVPDDSQASKKLVCIMLDKQKLTDPIRFFEQMDEAMQSIGASYKSFITSDLFQPSL